MAIGLIFRFFNISVGSKVSKLKDNATRDTIYKKIAREWLNLAKIVR